MMRHAALLGMLYVFIQSMTNLSSIIFLVGPGNHLASVVILDAAIGSYSRIAHLVDALLATTLSISTLAENAPSEQWSLPQFAPTLENCHKAIRTSFLNRRRCAAIRPAVLADRRKFGSAPGPGRTPRRTRGGIRRRRGLAGRHRRKAGSMAVRGGAAATDCLLNGQLRRSCGEYLLPSFAPSSSPSRFS